MFVFLQKDFCWLLLSNKKMAESDLKYFLHFNDLSCFSTSTFLSINLFSDRKKKSSDKKSAFFRTHFVSKLPEILLKVIIFASSAVFKSSSFLFQTTSSAHVRALIYKLNIFIVKKLCVQKFSRIVPAKFLTFLGIR